MPGKRNASKPKASRPAIRSNGLSGKPASFARRLLLALGGVAVVVGGALFINSAPTMAEVVVYKNPSCGCCSKWADHLRAKGFSVEVKAVNNMGDVKERFGTPWKMESCHTALIDSYVIEGHVPVREINRLLAERPEVKGLAVPGMPAGSPGMEGRYTDSYNVMLFRSDGSTEVYAHY